MAKKSFGASTKEHQWYLNEDLGTFDDLYDRTKRSVRRGNCLAATKQLTDLFATWGRVMVNSASRQWYGDHPHYELGKRIWPLQKAFISKCIVPERLGEDDDRLVSPIPWQPISEGGRFAPDSTLLPHGEAKQWRADIRRAEAEDRRLDAEERRAAARRRRKR